MVRLHRRDLGQEALSAQGVAVEEFDRRSGQYRALYDSTTFEGVHAGILDLLPVHGSTVLDVGAGSGRDALALALRGYRVTAVEPSANMSGAAQVDRKTGPVEWIQDGLPELAQLDGRRFLFILVSAVWMYLHPESRPAAMKRLASLTMTGGLVTITLRSGEPEPARGFYPACTREVSTDAAAVGLVEVRRNDDEDTLRRAGVTWTTIVMRKT